MIITTTAYETVQNRLKLYSFESRCIEVSMSSGIPSRV